jgi:hypothetical protein
MVSMLLKSRASRRIKEINNLRAASAFGLSVNPDRGALHRVESHAFAHAGGRSGACERLFRGEVSYRV